MTTSDSENDSSLAVSEDFVQSPAHKAASITSIDFNGLLLPNLQLHENLTNGTWPRSREEVAKSNDFQAMADKPGQRVWCWQSISCEPSVTRWKIAQCVSTNEASKAVEWHKLIVWQS